MDFATREFVRNRADSRWEYCLIPQDVCALKHHIEHIIPKQHGGGDGPENLALACHRCNLHKGPNLTGIDPQSGEIVPLFHPRLDDWAAHFRFPETLIEGLTATGRATARLLCMNDTRRIELRALSASLRDS